MALTLDLSGQTVIVTGASGGIGAGIARRLAEAGARIVIVYRNDVSGAEAVAADCPDAVIVQADLGISGSANRLFSRVLETCQRVDAVVNCAGPQSLAALAELDDADFQAMQETHVTAPAQLIRLLAAHLAGRGAQGAVVNIASIEAMRPAPGHAHYAAAKAGLVMLTRAAALEFGPSGLRVNAVSPGLIARPGIAEQWPEGVARWTGAAPLGRLGTPRDIADATAFLLSPMADWITGANLVVDGGMMAGPGW